MTLNILGYHHEEQTFKCVLGMSLIISSKNYAKISSTKAAPLPLRIRKILLWAQRLLSHKPACLEPKKMSDLQENLMWICIFTDLILILKLNSPKDKTF